MSVSDVVLTKRGLLTAVNVLRQGGIIAYPTESCFGLGCDPQNNAAVRHILTLKGRSYRKGLILVAADLDQANQYGRYQALPKRTEIENSWPGPNTWLLPPTHRVSRLLRGQYDSIAVRVTAHPVAAALCRAFGGAIVSTSANLQGQPSLTDHQAVKRQFGHRLDYIVAADVGNDNKPSTIRDGTSGKILRQ